MTYFLLEFGQKSEKSESQASQGQSQSPRDHANFPLL